ncbi:MAG: sulfotransferase [Symploca sp. SIO2C1]|nr:sulfotransferase [Symploca sp. SIO2C1]
MPYKILFLLGHMRSGSSLLSHILVTNPEIVGFGETHIKYSVEGDFEKLILKIHQVVGNSPVDLNYFFDKILHNNMFINEAILCSEQVYLIFLLREPQQSLASIIKLKPHWNQKQALGYYSRRLAKLETYAKLINSKKRSFFLTHDQLLHKTELVFKSLQYFLQVQQPFSEEYEILPTTGMRFIGDQSERIKSGRIIRYNQISESSISPDLIKQGIQAFDQCINTLSEYCQTI